MAQAQAQREAIPEAVWLHNRTRRSRSIAGRLIREGTLHLVPVYWLLHLSDLAREGIRHSGSFDFADHIYRSAPSGRTILGRWIDRRLLAMPAAQAFRRRYTRAQEAMLQRILALRHTSGPIRLLTVPCGIPRDVHDVARTLAAREPSLLRRVRYVGMDLDPAAIARARELLAACPLRAAQLVTGNALRRDDYPAGPFDVVCSTGLGEFLNDAALAQLYANVYDVLAPGGIFYTSATTRDEQSEPLLQLAELRSHDRSDAQLEAMLRQLPWRQVSVERASVCRKTSIA